MKLELRSMTDSKLKKKFSYDFDDRFIGEEEEKVKIKTKLKKNHTIPAHLVENKGLNIYNVMAMNMDFT